MPDGFDGHISVISDVVDRGPHKELMMWISPEQQVAFGNTTMRRIPLHGPPYVLGDRAYLSYGAAGLVILDISDIERPTLVSRLEIGAAFSSMIALHTAIPLPSRNLLLVNTQAIAERQQEPYNFAGIVDTSDERNPRLVSLLPIARPAAGRVGPRL